MSLLPSMKGSRPGPEPADPPSGRRETGRRETDTQVKEECRVMLPIRVARMSKVAKMRSFLVVLAGCTCLALAAAAWAAQTLTINTRFTPDKLGAPTNLSA